MDKSDYIEKLTCASFQKFLRIESILYQAVMCKESINALCTSMKIFKVNYLDLIVFTKRIEFSRRHNSFGKDLIGTKVKVFTAMNAHEYDVIFLIFIALGVLLFPVLELVLARLPIKDIVEVISPLEARCVEI